jgi:hypothetical protein
MTSPQATHGLLGSAALLPRNDALRWVITTGPLNGLNQRTSGNHTLIRFISDSIVEIPVNIAIIGVKADSFVGFA